MRDAWCAIYRYMRTTLSLDDDVLSAARALAEHQRKSLGQVVSELARQTLQGRDGPKKIRNGVLLLPSRGRPGSITMEHVNRLRDELP